jgi:hypothetical protein
MFGIWKRKQPEVLKHWYALILDFETSTTEFYNAIEHDLAARELTGLEISRIDYAEGGLLSAKREYLRMRRERLIFDVCCAPFGTTWFFSCRFSQIPVQLMLWEIIVMLLVFAGIAWFYTSLFGLMLGSILLGSSLLSLLLLMRSTVRLGFQDLDAALLQIPIIGAFYEIFLRRNDTYYRQDTRLAYMDIVDFLVRAKIDEVTKAKGVELVQYVDATPPSHPSVLRMIADLLRLAR